MSALPSESVELCGPYDRGIPNEERIVLYPKNTVNLSWYGVMAIRETDTGERILCPDHLFWFGNYVVSPPICVFLYTGPGQFRETTVAGMSTPAWVFHWGKPTTMFTDSRIIPVLVKFDTVNVGEHAKDLPQSYINDQIEFTKR